MKATLASAVLLVLTCGGALLASAAPLADAEVPEDPDMAFLEYLGMWDESDEEWQLLDDESSGNDELERRADPAPEGKESTEKDDEV